MPYSMRAVVSIFICIVIDDLIRRIFDRERESESGSRRNEVRVCYTIIIESVQKYARALDGRCHEQLNLCGGRRPETKQKTHTHTPNGGTNNMVWVTNWIKLRLGIFALRASVTHQQRLKQTHRHPFDIEGFDKLNACFCHLWVFEESD